MKLHCKHCNKQLTKSLYPSKWKLKEFIEDYYGEGTHKRILHIPVGAFRRWKSWSGDRFVAVHRDSLLLSIPNINGCCDHDWTPVTCDCGAKLGVSRYDCWQSQHSVDLEPNKVYFTN